ncbi:MAG: signal recognition particle protein [Acidobacteria bacterium RIFCSPHIGHO2_01_FULL_67_28]|nr:MAG: signal recognition particle protein [Acidobacteria bacterium RIFCSPHIGHO2_01_FULL_67_28]
MFEALTEKLGRTFKSLRGEGKLSEAHITEALSQIRLALLEGDVHFQVVQQLTDNIRRRALGQEVLLALSPDQQVLKIVRDELVQLLGVAHTPLQFAKKPPSIIFLTGLQGSGKTTTTGKLGKWLAKTGHRPMAVSTDVRRPAAREQLRQIARAVGLPVVEKESSDPLELLKAAKREAELSAYDVVLVDTQGRLHIDAELMGELEAMKKAYPPVETLFVADAMTGQDAVKSAGTFHERLSLTGVILTKMDGDARGGAALSIRWVTGQPIKFIGTGEKYDALEPFHPDRIASRILGLGDVLSLIEKAEETVDRAKAEELEEKLRRAEFTLEDFRDQLRQLKKMGPLDQVLDMIPGVAPEVRGQAVDDRKLKRLEAIIDSMTPKERRRPDVLDGRRRRRVARGSGTTVQEINQLLRQFAEMRRLMKAMKGGEKEAMRKLAARFGGKMKLPL